MTPRRAVLCGTELLVPRIEVEGVGLIALPPTFPSTMTIEELGATVAPL
jgi:hypothetical protein